MQPSSIRIAVVLTAVLLATALGACAPAARVDTIAVQQQLTDLLELHTYEHIYRDVVYFGEEKSFLFVRTVDRQVLFAVDIRVRAGVDLSEGFQLVRDAASATTVYVRLPPAKVLSVDADEKSIHEYFIREQGGRIGLLDITGQLEEVKVRTELDAVERGILRRAEENAKRIVRDFLIMAGFEEVLFAPASEDGGELRG